MSIYPLNTSILFKKIKVLPMVVTINISLILVAIVKAYIRYYKDKLWIIAGLSSNSPFTLFYKRNSIASAIGKLCFGQPEIFPAAQNNLLQPHQVGDAFLQSRIALIAKNKQHEFRKKILKKPGNLLLRNQVKFN